jgi:predicted transcriptional regulator
MNKHADILISLKPRHAEYIFDGEKTVELRRRRLKIDPGTKVWIYATAPVAAIKGHASLIRIESAPPSLMWKTWGKRTGLSNAEFNSYFEDCNIAHALLLDKVMLMERALPLTRIRELIHGFQPPQFYFHLNGATEEMRLPARKHHRVKIKRTL